MNSKVMIGISQEKVATALVSAINNLQDGKASNKSPSQDIQDLLPLFYRYTLEGKV